MNEDYSNGTLNKSTNLFQLSCGNLLTTDFNIRMVILNLKVNSAPHEELTQVF